MRVRDAGRISAHDPIYRRHPDPQDAYDRMRVLAALHHTGGELHFGHVAEKLGDPLDTSVIARASAVLSALINNGLVGVDSEAPTLHRLTTPSDRDLAATLGE